MLVRLLAAVVPVVLIMLICRPFQDVSRARLTRFARRQGLVVTPANGQRVIAYLATTRRWRAGGIMAAAGATGMITATTDSGVTAGAVPLICGWFAGALVAEWRVSFGRRDGVLRAASLAPRRLTDYAGRWLGPAVLTGLSLTAGVQVWLLVRAPGRREYEAGLLILTVLLALAGSAVSRRVLHRPQPLGDEQVPTDDALRSRSLHVLLGSVLSLCALLLGAALDALDSSPELMRWNSLRVLCLLLLIAGVLGATATHVARMRRGEVPLPAVRA